MDSLIFFCDRCNLHVNPMRWQCRSANLSLQPPWQRELESHQLSVFRNLLILDENTHFLQGDNLVPHRFAWYVPWTSLTVKSKQAFASLRSQTGLGDWEQIWCFLYISISENDSPPNLPSRSISPSASIPPRYCIFWR
jgi:hypothetical protein